MKKYQIRLLRSDGCGAYIYFEAEPSQARDAACDKANEFLLEHRRRDQLLSSPFHSPYSPVKTGIVVEYDDVKKNKVRKGEKFKIHLSFFEIGFKNGNSVRDNWYSIV